jgi:apolipoprotein N-acyltransferase
MNEQGVLLVPLPGHLPPTPFARFGLWIPFTLALLCLLIGLLGSRRRIAG